MEKAFVIAGYPLVGLRELRQHPVRYPVECIRDGVKDFVKDYWDLSASVLGLYLISKVSLDNSIQFNSPPSDGLIGTGEILTGAFLLVGGSMLPRVLDLEKTWHGNYSRIARNFIGGGSIGLGLAMHDKSNMFIEVGACAAFLLESARISSRNSNGKKDLVEIVSKNEL